MTVDDHLHKLAEWIVSEKRLVTYRLLSRELKCHVNRAKEYRSPRSVLNNLQRMLYEYYMVSLEKGNKLHATYIISGFVIQKLPETLKRSRESSSSPLQTQDSTVENDQDVRVRTVSLIPEEDLDKSKASFAEISSIHIYSLEPNPLKDLTVLATVSQDIRINYPELISSEEMSKVYGSVYNPEAHRKAVSTARLLPTKQPVQIKRRVAPVTRPEASEEPSRLESDSQAEKPAHPSKKEMAANFFGSKSTMKKLLAPKIEETDPSPIHAAELPAKAASKKDKTLSKDVAVPKKNKASRKSESPRGIFPYDRFKLTRSQEADDETAKSQSKEQEEALSRLMDEDTEMEDVNIPEPPQETVMEAAVQESRPGAGPAAPERKHGRRKVTKKVTSKDAKGYLVTKEETAWESFSESEKDQGNKTKATFDAAPTNFAAFHVPLNVNKLDIKDYLWNIYGLEVKSVKTLISHGDMAKFNSKKPGENWKFRLPSKKKAIVEFEKPFYYPEVPKNLNPWNKLYTDYADAKIQAIKCGLDEPPERVMKKFYAQQPETMEEFIEEPTNRRGKS
ncbi:DNA polymerase delta subunit 3 [Neolecta irregularis DAH-3]|uniref:DNA polymerase delta subunit 3 n=1 Tax=Neolecta irregularis (strain DAH-3) TaxID=1198029 RepID=A0A1U7LS50_NEOID|nr:DNA polymerase delta subunit 3 [Neolecta irregularis DAH-3]|eukprot:OLL25495.1 DNA polymerase delta subunit 3 [Neolecta irregularis DAH-3]